MKRIAFFVATISIAASTGFSTAKEKASPPFSGDVAPRVVDSISKADYDTVVAFIKKNGRTTEVNDRHYDFRDAFGYTHDLIARIRPEGVPWTSDQARPMQVDAFASGPADFSYVLVESGQIIYDCRCGTSTPTEVRTKYDSIIRSAVGKAITLAKEP